MGTVTNSIDAPENDFLFITTPEPAPKTLEINRDCGVKIISVCIALTTFSQYNTHINETAL